MGGQAKRKRRDRDRHPGPDPKKARPVIERRVRVSFSLDIDVRDAEARETDVIRGVIDEKLRELRGRYSLAPEVISVTADGVAMYDLDAEIRGHAPLHVSLKDDSFFGRIDAKLDAMSRRIEEAKRESQEAKMDGETAKRERDALKVRMDDMEIITTEMAMAECRAVANRVLLLAAMGWKKKEPRNEEAMAAAFATLAKRNRALLGGTSHEHTFAEEALALNEERNLHAHPEPWSKLRRRVLRAQDKYLRSKKVRKSDRFVTYVLKNHEELVPDEYKTG